MPEVLKFALVGASPGHPSRLNGESRTGSHTLTPVFVFPMDSAPTYTTVNLNE